MYYNQKYTAQIFEKIKFNSSISLSEMEESQMITPDEKTNMNNELHPEYVDQGGEKFYINLWKPWNADINEHNQKHEKVFGTTLPTPNNLKNEYAYQMAFHNSIFLCEYVETKESARYYNYAVSYGIFFYRPLRLFYIIKDNDDIVFYKSEEMAIENGLYLIQQNYLDNEYHFLYWDDLEDHYIFAYEEDNYSDSYTVRKYGKKWT